MTLTLTTEQQAPYTLKATDGRGRMKPIDGPPVVTSSDETVIKADAPVAVGDGSWTFNVIATGIAGVATITVEADVDISPDIQDVIATDDITVTLDPRTAARTVAITAGAPVDQP